MIPGTNMARNICLLLVMLQLNDLEKPLWGGDPRERWWNEAAQGDHTDIIAPKSDGDEQP